MFFLENSFFTDACISSIAYFKQVTANRTLAIFVATSNRFCKKIKYPNLILRDSIQASRFSLTCLASSAMSV